MYLRRLILDEYFPVKIEDVSMRLMKPEQA